MHIVIEIPESILNTIQADEMISREQLAILQMHILKGIPLPKGHGRLIDADDLESRMKIGYCIVRDAPTIVEADKEGTAE